MDRQSIVDEMERARDDFHRLVDPATTAELHRQSNGTKWTNDQLLFHMLFGYLIVIPRRRASSRPLRNEQGVRPRRCTPGDESREGPRLPAQAGHALPYGLGPLLPGVHDHRGPLSLRDPALRPPPETTHPCRHCCILSSPPRRPARRSPTDRRRRDAQGPVERHDGRPTVVGWRH